jgi:hypothetical protein
VKNFLIAQGKNTNSLFFDSVSLRFVGPIASTTDEHLKTAKNDRENIVGEEENFRCLSRGNFFRVFSLFFVVL